MMTMYNSSVLNFIVANAVPFGFLISIHIFSLAEVVRSFNHLFIVMASHSEAGPSSIADTEEYTLYKVYKTSGLEMV